MPFLLTECYGFDRHPNGVLGPMDPTLDSTYDFLAAFMEEVANRFHDDYVHVGGDEVPKQCWWEKNRFTIVYDLYAYITL